MVKKSYPACPAEDFEPRMSACTVVLLEFVLAKGGHAFFFLTRYRALHNCDIFEHLTRYSAITDFTTSHGAFSCVVVKPRVWALVFYL